MKKVLQSDLTYTGFSFIQVEIKGNNRLDFSILSGESMSDSTGLPTIMESNSSLQKNSGNMRPQSLSERTLNAPVVRNIMQTFSHPQNRFISPGSPSDRRSDDKFERISLTMNPE